MSAQHVIKFCHPDHARRCDMSWFANMLAVSFGYKEKISNNEFKMWVVLQKISPYYLILSNYFEKCKDLIDLNKINIDLNIYKVSISDKTKKIYEVLFYNELK